MKMNIYIFIGSTLVKMVVKKMKEQNADEVIYNINNESK